MILIDHEVRAQMEQLAIQVVDLYEELNAVDKDFYRQRQNVRNSRDAGYLNDFHAVILRRREITCAIVDRFNAVRALRGSAIYGFQQLVRAEKIRRRLRGSR